ncbi:MAG TPA: phosphoribosyltransferase family protein [Candidatus Saccharimonadales bacterium]|nr:phosphoribosyltransferase family protein [Candidatus Saccharimonadales bacterium]
MAAEYSGMVAELVRRYKFERLRAAYIPLAAGIDGIMSYVSPATLIVPVPTAPSRVRQRGYDQATLLARELARLRSLPYATPLLRHAEGRQLGLGRTARKTQAHAMFVVRDDVRDKHVLIVDDVCTTGATLQAASAALKGAGAASVQAAVVAWTAPK